VKGATHTKDPIRHLADSALARDVRKICTSEALSLKAVERWMGGPAGWLCIWMLGTTSLGPVRLARVQRFLAAYHDASLPVDDLKARRGRRMAP
jgi:hypothetical protein